jgi:hypothetical protein
MVKLVLQSTNQGTMASRRTQRLCFETDSEGSESDDDKAAGFDLEAIIRKTLGGSTAGDRQQQNADDDDDLLSQVLFVAIVIDCAV